MSAETHFGKFSVPLCVPVEARVLVMKPDGTLQPRRLDSGKLEQSGSGLKKSQIATLYDKPAGGVRRILLSPSFFIANADNLLGAVKKLVC